MAGIMADAAVVVAQAGAAEIADRVMAHAGRMFVNEKITQGERATFSLFLLWQNFGPCNNCAEGEII